MSPRIVAALAVGLLGCPGAPVDVPDAGGTPGDGGYTCTVETIDADAGARVVSYVSLALDSSGAPHVAYFHAAAGALHVATRGAAGWSAARVNAAGAGGSLVTLRLDSADRAHVGYYSSQAASVMYATNASGSWATETVAAQCSSSSLALDGSGAPRLALARNTPPHGLKHATRSGTSWPAVDIDDAGEPDQVSLELDTAGKNHITYVERSAGGLRYATDVSGAWAAQTIDPGMLGTNSSLGIDPAGKLHVVYLDTPSSRVKYATNASGAWVATPLDAAGEVTAGDTSLAIDDQGKLHVTYYRATVRDLGYATNRSGAWVAMPLVAGANDLGVSSSLAVDSVRDVLHAAFANRTTGGVEYVSCRR